MDCLSETAFSLGHLEKGPHVLAADPNQCREKAGHQRRQKGIANARQEKTGQDPPMQGRQMINSPFRQERQSQQAARAEKLMAHIAPKPQPQQPGIEIELEVNTENIHQYQFECLAPACSPIRFFGATSKYVSGIPNRVIMIEILR